MRKVLILDTSILCVWLKVPGKETCGSGANTITYDAVYAKIEEDEKNLYQFKYALEHLDLDLIAQEINNKK